MWIKYENSNKNISGVIDQAVANIDVEEQIWLPNIKHLWLDIKTS